MNQPPGYPPGGPPYPGQAPYPPQAPQPPQEQAPRQPHKFAGTQLMPTAPARPGMQPQPPQQQPPQQAYGQPPPGGFGAPVQAAPQQQAYGQPPPGYGQPQAPPPAYGQPPPQQPYGAPAQQQQQFGGQQQQFGGQPQPAQGQQQFGAPPPVQPFVLQPPPQQFGGPAPQPGAQQGGYAGPPAQGFAQQGPQGQQQPHAQGQQQGGGGFGIALGGVGAGGIPRVSIATGDFHPNKLWKAVVTGDGYEKPRRMGGTMIGLAVALVIVNVLLIRVVHIYYPYFYSLGAVVGLGGFWMVASGQPRNAEGGAKAPTWGRIGLAVCLALGVLLGLSMIFTNWER